MSDVVQGHAPVNEPAAKRAKTTAFDYKQFVGVCPVCLISHDEVFTRDGDKTELWWGCNCMAINPCCSLDCASQLLKDNKGRDKCVFQKTCWSSDRPLPPAPVQVDHFHPAYGVPGAVPKTCEHCGEDVPAKDFSKHQRDCPKLLVEPDGRYECGCDLVEQATAITYECCPHCMQRICPRCARPCTEDSCESMPRKSPDGLFTGTASEVSDYQRSRESQKFGFNEAGIPLCWCSPSNIGQMSEGLSLMRFLVDPTPTTKLPRKVLDKCLVRIGDDVRGPCNTLCGQYGCDECTGSRWEGLRDFYAFRSSPCAKKFIKAVVTKSLYYRCVSFDAYKDGDWHLQRGTPVPLKFSYSIDPIKRKITFCGSHEGTTRSGVKTVIMIKVFRRYANQLMEPLSDNYLLTITDDKKAVTDVYDGGRRLQRAEYHVVATTLRQRLASHIY